MKGYKGFEHGLICKGKQYSENMIFEEPKAEICKSGMHFCKNPFDVLDYYPLINDNSSFNDFAEVESMEDTQTDDGKKFCTTKLKIGSKLSFSEFIKACIDFVINEIKIDDARIGSSGDGAQIGSSGDGAQICSSGDGAQIGSSGDWARIGSSGDWARIGSSGVSARIGSSGVSARIGSSGDRAQIDCTGNDSVICCAGRDCSVKARKGCWITLSEWEYSKEKGKSIPKCVKTEFVDGEKIMSDTWYILKNGEFVSCEDKE